MYKNFDIKTFLQDVNNSNINKLVTGTETLDAAAEIFEEKFRSILDYHAPMKTVQIRKNYSAFISEETKDLISVRKVLQEEVSKTGNPVLLKEFRYKCKEVKREVKTDEKKYFEANFSEEAGVTNAWRTANEILGTTKNLAPTVIKHQEENEKPVLVTSPKKIATIFNNFFRNKVEKLRNKTNKPSSILPTDRLKNWLKKRPEPPPSFKIKKVDKVILRKAIKRMKGKRGHGVDTIDSYSLKLASPLIEDSLLHLVNLSIANNTFATPWKPQLIFPLHKKKEKTKVENFRPVSHLVEVGKLCEYIVYEQILEHFNVNKLFHPNHHGSLSNHSTATALIQLTDMWLEAAEMTELSGACMIDQSAAYDLLCHMILQEKLGLYNFDQGSISWIMSYLSNRTQAVQVESKVSNFLECGDHGVPQGSILGGLLHVINSNDFPDCHEEGESVVYVDDDTDSVHSNDPVQLKNMMQKEVNNSVSWLQDNRLCVAGDKSKFLVIGTKQLRSSKLTNLLSINVDGQEIQETESEKLLGVVVNNQLTWQHHLHGDEENSGLIPQLKQRVGTLRRLSKYMNKKRLSMMGSGIFYSKLVYCLPVFGNVFGLDRY